MRPSIPIVLFTLLLAGCATTGGNHAGNVTHEAMAASTQHYRAAVSAYRKRQLMQAFEQASAAVEQNPANADAWGLLGLINQRLDQPDDAAKAFRRALTLAPENAPLRTNYGNFLCSQKQWDEARKAFTTAANLQSNARPEIAWTNAAICARRAGDDALAEQLLQKAIQHNPGQPTALYQLASLSLKKGKPVEASTWLDQYLNHAVHTPKTLLLGARIEQAAGNPAGVESYLEKLRSAFPDSPERREAEALMPLQPAGQASSTIHGADWLQQLDPGHYTIQIGAYPDEQQARRAASGLRPPVAIVQSGSLHVVLQGDYATLALARAALNSLKTARPDLAPWVRDIGAIRATIPPQ